MSARVLSTDSHFSDGHKSHLPKGPLLKRLTYNHCRKLVIGERIWLPEKETGTFVAATVTALSKGNASVAISYNAGNRSGFFTVYQVDKVTDCYRFLDEETLSAVVEEFLPRLRVVGEE